MNWKTQYMVRTFLLQELHDTYDLRRTAMSKAIQSKDNMPAAEKEK